MANNPEGFNFSTLVTAIHQVNENMAGSDRADYGDKLLSELAKRLTDIEVSNCNRRQLYRYLRFYRLYPQIVGTPSPQLQIPPEKLVYRFSYERSGLSQNKEQLAELAQSGAEKSEPNLAVHDPYVFEFLGIKSREIMRESDLEDQLLDKLQDFLLELGHGFCFEARQKRILIGDVHGFVDLVFYHRILKCHVLVELKVDSFNHENLGQLNTYVSWYRKNMMADGDNPPVGILLCTQKDHALVEYALAGMDNHLFVSKYQLELPRKEEIQRFLEDKMREVRDGE